jgi:hypothetical protein
MIGLHKFWNEDIYLKINFGTMIGNHTDAGKPIKIKP